MYHLLEDGSIVGSPYAGEVLNICVFWVLDDMDPESEGSGKVTTDLSHFFFKLFLVW
jgi:hypothetical protein